MARHAPALVGYSELLDRLLERGVAGLLQVVVERELQPLALLGSVTDDLALLVAAAERVDDTRVLPSLAAQDSSYCHSSPLWPIRVPWRDPLVALAACAARR